MQHGHDGAVAVAAQDTGVGISLIAQVQFAAVARLHYCGARGGGGGTGRAGRGGGQARGALGDVGDIHKADFAVVADHPVVVALEQHVHRGAVGNLQQHARVGTGIGAQVQPAAVAGAHIGGANAAHAAAAHDQVFAAEIAVHRGAVHLHGNVPPAVGLLVDHLAGCAVIEDAQHVCAVAGGFAQVQKPRARGVLHRGGIGGSAGYNLEVVFAHVAGLPFILAGIQAHLIPVARFALDAYPVVAVGLAKPGVLAAGARAQVERIGIIHHGEGRAAGADGLGAGGAAHHAQEVFAHVAGQPVIQGDHLIPVAAFTHHAHAFAQGHSAQPAIAAARTGADVQGFSVVNLCVKFSQSQRAQA